MSTLDPGAGDSQESAGGSIPGEDGQSAFLLRRSISRAIPVLIAVPHAGRGYPASLVGAMRHPQQAGLRLEDRFMDLVGLEVARTTGASLLVAHAPRAMIDLNRSPDDIDWDMVAGTRAGALRTRIAAGRRARSGLGLVPRRLPGLGELWRQPLRADDLTARIAQVHAPYHETLARTLETLRDQWGGAVLIDLHSMPPLGPKDGDEGAVDFVLGDRFGASSEHRLIGAALDHFEAAGCTLAHNRPYAGGYALDRHGAPARGISAIQLEVCRTTYLDPALREPGDGFAWVAEVIAGMVRRLTEEVVRRTEQFPQAAE